VRVSAAVGGVTITVAEVRVTVSGDASFIGIYHPLCEAPLTCSGALTIGSDSSLSVQLTFTAPSFGDVVLRYTATGRITAASNFPWVGDERAGENVATAWASFVVVSEQLVGTVLRAS
jgi:hypothetical protein